jgi:HPr kinase/phosphorylase
MTVDDVAGPSGAPTITVRRLLDELGGRLDVRLVAGGGGLDREIAHARIQKSGLSMLGHRHGVVPTRVQVLGETEMSYARSLGPEEQRQAATHLFSMNLACVLATCGSDPPRSFRDEAERSATPLLVCEERSSAAITGLHTLLDECLAPRTSRHGVLVDIFEIGVLLLGPSGIGKSEIALELVMRGHRLVADDMVEFDFRPPGMVFGQAAELLRHHIEVRGLGILNIKDLYGVTSIRDRKRVDLVVRLEFWNEESVYDRVGVDDTYCEILSVPIREVCLPVRPGRNVGSIIEIAARNELLRQAGHHSAKEFVRRVEGGMANHESTSEMRAVRLAKPPESTAPPPVKWRKPK